MAHAGYLSPAQQVQLFTGGLPDPLRTDVELQAPADLQRAMSLARAYERRATALLAAQGHQQRFLDQSPPPLQSAPTATATPTSTPSMPAAPPRQLRRLSSAEMAERRHQGLITVMSLMFRVTSVSACSIWKCPTLMHQLNLALRKIQKIQSYHH